MKEELEHKKIILSCVLNKFTEIPSDDKIYNLYHFVLESEYKEKQYCVYGKVSDNEYILTETLAQDVYDLQHGK